MTHFAILAFGSMTALSGLIHQSNVDAGWWTDKDTGETLLGRDDRGRFRRNNGELMMLVVSEAAEASEGVSRMDDKLPHRRMFEVELADTAIRLLDLGGARGTDFDAVIGELVAFEEGPDIDGHNGNENDACMSIVCAVAEAMEGDRKGSTSKRAPSFSQFDVGITLALVAVFEVGSVFGYDVMSALHEKWEFNKTRPDHKLENRRAEGGKAY